MIILADLLPILALTCQMIRVTAAIFVPIRLKSLQKIKMV